MKSGAVDTSITSKYLRRTTPSTGPARAVNDTSRNALARAGSGAGPAQAYPTATVAM
jgi:hypothetical protein